MKAMTHDVESTVASVSLLMAFELGERWWKLGFTTGLGQRARTRRIAAGAVDMLRAEIARAKARFGLLPEAAVISCYEAGRDGFWLHRYLIAHGITNHVIDSSSIEVNRRARRNKTDLLDLGGLLTLLARYRAGDGRCWQELTAVDAERVALPIDLTTSTGRAVASLQKVRAVGPVGAWVLATEIFGWREIRNRRQLGALVGLVPSQYQSGEMCRDRGITRAGNAHVRRLMVQLAWGWLRWQPTSALAQWYQPRFAGGGPRLRRIGIVALARKLLVALWRYVDQGIVPEGATLKSATA